MHNPGYEYLIMLSAHAIHSAGNQTLYIWVFLLQAAHTIALCCSEHICDQIAKAMHL